MSNPSSPEEPQKETSQDNSEEQIEDESDQPPEEKKDDPSILLFEGSQDEEPPKTVKSDPKTPREEPHQDNDENSLTLSPEYLAMKYKEFLQEKELKIQFDVSKIDLLPAPLRPSVQLLVKLASKLHARKPRGIALSVLEVFTERLSQFLELQEDRDDPSYDYNCQQFLAVMYQNIIEARRFCRELKADSKPRSLDEAL